MKRFNIAYMLTNKAHNDFCVDLAQSHFKDVQDKYLLGHQALPHVTLCQFYAESNERAVRIYKSFAPAVSIENLIIEKCQVRSGTLVNAGKFIVELKVQANSALSNLQKLLFEHIEQSGGRALTPIQTYSPHITLARIHTMPMLLPAEAPDAQIVQISVRLSLGASTEEGVFIHEIV